MIRLASWSSRASSQNAPMRLTRRQSRSVAQGQMPPSRGIRGSRLDRSRRRSTAARRFAARLLRYRRSPRYAGRVGSGINRAELARLWHRLQPLAVSQMPLEVPPPRSNRFGSPLVLSRLHWVRPELVAEVKFLTWTDDNLLRQVVYEGLREDKQASEICRPVPHPKPAATNSTVTRPRPPRR
jgi:ATP-dependent DNA ligase